MTAEEQLQTWIADLHDRDPDVRMAAARSLRQSASGTAAAIPDLCRLLEDREAEVRKEVAETLAALGVPAVPVLVKILRDSSPDARSEAAFALGEIGPPAVAALPALTAAALTDATILVRRWAAEALGLIGAGRPEALKALRKALKDWDSAVRCSAAFALGRLGPEAATAADALIAMLKDPHPNVYREVAVALGKIGPPAIEQLRPALMHHAAEVRCGAAFALGMIGPPAWEAIPRPECDVAGQQPACPHRRRRGAGTDRPAPSAGIAGLARGVARSQARMCVPLPLTRWARCIGRMMRC